MIDKVFELTRTEEFKGYLAEILLELCSHNTTPDADIDVMKEAESACFDLLERELKHVTLGSAKSLRLPIDPSIKNHPSFSQLHFTKTKEMPEGMTPEEVYRDRVNLVYTFSGTGEGVGENTALNAHVDIVEPFVKPTLKDGVVYGRGACDDKGGCITIAAALRILSELARSNNLTLKKNITAMFVIEEETGGNGSLSLSLDKDLKKLYDSIMVFECTGGNIHPANRGAVWYHGTLSGHDTNLFEMSAFAIEELEQEGRAIKAESRHRLFPQRPVQTCHGVIGHFGEHPSRICGEVSFDIIFDSLPEENAEEVFRDVIDSAITEYCSSYGDKTRISNPLTGKPTVDHHYDISRNGNAVTVDIHGSTGHMGAVDENDGAITKMAAIVRSLVSSRKYIEKHAGVSFVMNLHNAGPEDKLIIEGGQGFIPNHSIDEIMSRMAAALQNGAEKYLRLTGSLLKGNDAAVMTYDKLHNDAFDGDPESKTMQNAVAAAKECGIWKDQPVTGWNVSCDSRIFAVEYPQMPVLTCGAGHLTHAHSDEEQLSIEELRESVEFLTMYLLRQCFGIN